MRYENTVAGIFVDRPNRFVAHVEIAGVPETVHVKNTGRCRELLIPGARVILQHCDKPERKTAYDLISVWKPNLGWVNIDSQVPNKVVGEWLQRQSWDLIKPEYTYGGSRLDYYLEKDGQKLLMEIKGCTLEIDNVGYFPDAPSVRACKHCNELAEAVKQGYRCVIGFVIAMEQVSRVEPNVEKDPAFAKALANARNAGVEVWQLPCKVEPDGIRIIDELVKMDEWTP